MFVGLKEIRSAPGRSGVIITTVALITLMVGFISALMAGLSHEAISELEDRLGDDGALVLSDTAGGTWTASQLTDEEIAALGGDPMYFVRTRLGDDPVALLGSRDLTGSQARISPSLQPNNDAATSDSVITVSGRTFDVVGTTDDMIEHLPIVEVSMKQARDLNPVATAVIVHNSNVPSVPGTEVFRGKDALMTSAAHKGQEMSLMAMTVLLYVISALVVGAFFAVWTMQRLRSIAITSALGAARTVLVADSMVQAFIVLLVGAGAGTLLSILCGLFLPASVPVVINLHVLAPPALIMMGCGLLGALFSLPPVLAVEPTAALARG